MENLAVIRVNRNLSLRELAARARVSWTTLHAIEHGRVVPRTASIRAIATALNVDPAEVVEFAGATERRRQRMIRSTSYRPLPHK